MERIVEMYLNVGGDNGDYGTGLYIKTESGKIYKHSSTDCIVPFGEISEEFFKNIK